MRITKIVVMALLLALSCGLAYYFHAKLKMGAIFTHFFYVPIILACIWWRRRGLVVPVFLVALLIFSHYVHRAPLVSVNDYLRAVMFVVVGIVSAVLSERIARQHDLLQKSEARFQRMVAGIPGMVYQFLLHPDGSMAFPFISEGCKEFFDVSRESVQRNAKVFLNLMRPDDRTAFRQSVSASAKSLSLLDFSGQAIVADEEKWFRALAGPEHQPNGDTLWNGVFVDISDSMQAKRIKHLNAVLRAIRNVNQLIVREKDRGRLIQSACENLIATRGYHNAWIALLDKAGSVVMTAEGGLGAHFLPMIERLRSTGLPPCGLKALKQSGVVVTANPSSECTDCPLSGVDNGGAGMAVWLKHGEVVYGMLAVSIPAELAKNAEEEELLREVAGDIAFALHDIELTEQHELAEEALRESEEQYRAIFESATDAVLVFDLDGTIVEANPAAYAAYGYSHEEMIRLNGKDIVHPERYHLFEDFKEQVKTTGSFFTESVDMRKDGSVFDVEVRGATFTFKGKPHLLAVVRDITERKRAEQERQKLEEQLRQSQKMEAIGHLAGGVAHDFRNQLTVIKGFTEMLLRQSLVADEGRDKIAEVLKAVERSTKLTSQLLVFSRKERLEPQVVDLSDLMADMSKSLSRMIGEDIRLSTKPADRPCRANVDPNLLRQAIMNLVVNARDAMPNGGDLTIETDVVNLDAESIRKHLGAKAGEYAAIFVEDTGIGMDEATRERIFEPFFTTKQVGEGTGLGLSMVYGFVEQSGGYIECQSEPGKGTRLSLYFPRVDQTATETKTVAESQEPSRGSETILVVEDEEPLRRMLVKSLQESGYRVLEAANSVEALPLGEHFENQIDMLVTDVVMPGMNGIELAERIKAARPDIAVLFVSGYAQDELSRRGADFVKGNLLLVKPFSHETLLRCIRQVLASVKGASSHGTD